MKLKIALLGATGTVGQKVIKMLENHPMIEIEELVASERNVGKEFGTCVDWRESGKIPDSLKNLKLLHYSAVKSKYAISSLPAEIAKEAEIFLAKNGTNIISNASAYRRDPVVPLVIPEVNSEQFALVHKQETPGKIITNPNCSTVFLSLGLAPLKKIAGIKHVSVVTLQALSGAGYPGVSSMDVIGNTVPNIGGEEEKIEWEAKKILGADFSITAHVNRVPVMHGHSVFMHVTFDRDVHESEVTELYQKLSSEHPELYKLHTDEFRPQPQKDVEEFDQRAHIGRIKQGGEANIVGLLSLGHNLVRGAAGAAILNLEALHNFLGEK
ncbi:MAG: aspartate-semialdehyde dehydrogenase [Bacteriovoracaceae bacterium]|nr:aspartate-semialdehyde dehydrogenase [Bacteriovoracaceae bacterium]